MGYIPAPDKAIELLKKYNTEDFHIRHARTVGGVLAGFAREHDPKREDYWLAVGILHDLDFEKYPEQHCVKTREMMQSEDIDEGFIRACISHGYGVCIDVEPQLYMEKVLFAVDELTGLIGAAALMRPTGMEGMEAKSVMKKFKDKKFAAGCSREVITKGAEMLGMGVPELAAKTLEIMKTLDF